jgi:ABC-type amino acid transport substrate-binding protein
MLESPSQKRREISTPTECDGDNSTHVGSGRTYYSQDDGAKLMEILCRVSSATQSKDDISALISELCNALVNQGRLSASLTGKEGSPESIRVKIDTGRQLLSMTNVMRSYFQTRQPFQLTLTHDSNSLSIDANCMQPDELERAFAGAREFFDHSSILSGLYFANDRLKKYFTIPTMGFLIGVVTFLVTNYAARLNEDRARLNEEIRNLVSTLDGERKDLQEKLQARDQVIHNLVPASLDAPIPFSPVNGSKLVGHFVILQWEENGKSASTRARSTQAESLTSDLSFRGDIPPHPNYIVEVLRPDGMEDRFVASNPQSKNTRYPVSLEAPIKPGKYLWRVVPGDIQEKREVLAGNWSGYYRFEIYPSVLERIKETKKVLVGVSYIQDSNFMRRDEFGEAWGFDAELMKAIAHGMKKYPDFEQLGETADYKDYPSIGNVLDQGLRTGEVDLALGSITKASFREERGIKFSKGYVESKLALVSAKPIPAADKAKVPGKTSKVGVVKETINVDAAEALAKKYEFAVVKEPSFQDLVKNLEYGALDFILIDDTLAKPLTPTFSEVKHYDVRELGEPYRKRLGYDKEEYAVAIYDPDLYKMINEIMDTEELRRRIAELKDDKRYFKH